jgi:hypothetical protein
MEITHVPQHESIIRKINSDAKKIKPIENAADSKDVIKKYKEVQNQITKKGTKVDKYR